MRGLLPHGRSARVADWSFLIDESGAFATPDAIPAASRWRPARAPGTLAEALLEQGASFDDLPPLDQIDCWYRASFATSASSRLRLQGLATLAEVFVDGRLALRSDNMFHAHDIGIPAPGRHDLYIRFRSVEREIATKSGRARWRPRMIVPAGLRHIRATALGRLPGFAPPTPPIGPWRPVELLEAGAGIGITRMALRATIVAGEAVLRVALDLAEPPPAGGLLWCEGREAPFETAGERRLVAELRMREFRRWTPHTHGEPHLYAVEARLGDHSVDLGRTGFREIRAERGAEGRDFALHVNDIPIFCRGACWTTADAVSLSGARDDCAPLLVAMREAGMNMVRAPGVTLYESDDFYALCDELGIMVWQDFAFANFDYPIHDDAFRASVETEARQFLERTAASPSLAVLCGGSEVFQQAAMLGLAESKWRSPLFDEILPRLAREHRPDAAYVENSPSGGALPFHVDSGVSHYYGVGAYRRTLDDARRADVRFASECLGFSNVPETSSLRRDFGEAPLAAPLFAARIPRDMGAAQTFADVTEHYMRLLYGCDPQALRDSDPELYLDIARAASAETMEATIGEWRRGGSTTHGALVWFLKDMWPSAGWGLIDSHGEPKSSYFALRRAFRPLSLILGDEGVNGLMIHLRNDGPRPVEGALFLTCYRDGETPVMQGSHRIFAPAHGVATLRDAQIWGGFFDTALAYRFGPPSHDLTVARFIDDDGGEAIEAFHFPLGRSAQKSPLGLSAHVELDAAGHLLALTTRKAAQSVKIEDAAGYRPAENWLHLSPRSSRRIRLAARAPGAEPPRGLVSALNGESVEYG